MQEREAASRLLSVGDTTDRMNGIWRLTRRRRRPTPPGSLGDRRDAPEPVAHGGPAPSEPPGTEIHLCDNYSHLLRAAADLAGRTSGFAEPPLVLFIDDQLPLSRDLRIALGSLTGAEFRCVSDVGAIDEFARLPTSLPDMLRRNLSWTGPRPVTPFGWTPDYLDGRTFDTAYVYHPGFFLSKVVAGRCRRVVMRDSGYSNYVPHRVPIRRALPRLFAGRSPRRQIWGEERWVDEIEVVRPDQLPEQVRHKAVRRTLDEMMSQLPPERAYSVARAFWGDHPFPETAGDSTALLITQPIERLEICSSSEKHALYSSITTRLRRLGYRVVVKPHPRDVEDALPDEPQLPAPFPIEAWHWLGQEPFELAVSLNSAALSDDQVSFADDHLQLVPPTQFYAAFWPTWPTLIDRAFHSWQVPATDLPIGEGSAASG